MKSCDKHKPTELTPNDVATVLNKNYRTILRWVKDGNFKDARKCEYCGTYLIPSSNVESYINSLRDTRWVGIHGKEEDSKDKNRRKNRKSVKR